MNRRDVLKTGAAVMATGALAGSFGTPSAVAQNAATTPFLKKYGLSAYSRTLHWLRKPDEVARAIREIGNTSVDLTVRSGSGHVNPENVTTELPVFVRGLRDNGVDVSMLAPTITDADDPNAEATLDAAAQLGIHHYWWGTYRYDETQPYWPQLDALKPKVEALVRLNEKYGQKAIAHPRNGSGSVSAAFFDLLHVLQDFDPRYVAFQYDTHHLMQAFDAGWVHQLRMGAPYIGGFVWKDIMIESADSPNPDDIWRQANTPPGDAAAGDFGGGGGGRGGNNPFPTKTRIRQVPVGTGMVNLPLIAATLKEIGFDGPMECEPEWPQLGGANGGRTELTISPEECIALLKRDKQTMDAVFATAGLM